MSTPGREPLPAGVVTLADHQAHAKSRLDDQAWAYFAGAAGDELTLQANVQAWQQLSLLPRVLQPLAGGHTRCVVLGRTLAHPIFLAPVAYQRLAHPDGELASAYAAAAQGAGMVVSTQASIALETIADAVRTDADRGPLWFQLYLQADRAFSRELVLRAEQAGYEALVLTVDAPTHGVRDRERRVGFRLPPAVSAVNLAAQPAAPNIRLNAGQSALFDGLLRHAPTWDDIAWLQTITRLPILLKGILHPADARQARALGVAGLIVSNHGGRTLDTSVASAHALPRIVDALDGACTVLVDGGIRRGTDVLKALALGANAVLIGRPYIFGLANAGAVGVAHVLRLLRDELEVAMALTGCQTLDKVSRELIWD